MKNGKQRKHQHKIDRVRPPRVQITYDVEVGGAIELKELPFVVGVMGDFVGKSEEPLPAIKNRKFVEIDPDNFNQVLAGMKPRVAFSVDNKLQNDGSKVGVDLKFSNIEDFEPDNVVQQVEPLRKLVEARQRLSDLRSKMDGNDKLESMLNDIITDADKQKQLSDALGIERRRNKLWLKKQTKQQKPKLRNRFRRSIFSTKF
jgi:type VI secretion system protein ImpB